jgi:hypothetical protein
VRQTLKLPQQRPPHPPRHLAAPPFYGGFNFETILPQFFTWSSRARARYSGFNYGTGKG